MAKQRQVRIEQKSALANMAQLEQKSDEELESETRYRAAAQAILGARASERLDAKRAREHFKAAIAAARPQERMQLRRMAEASLALAERRPDDLKAAAEKLGQPAPTNRQLFALRVMRVVAPPPGSPMIKRVGGVAAVLLFIVAVFALAFGIVQLIGLAFGGVAYPIFWALVLVLAAIAVLVVVGRRRQAKQRAKVAEQRAQMLGR
jgi:hypothetical protein